MKIQIIGWSIAILVVTVFTFVWTSNLTLAIAACAFVTCLALGV